MKSDARVRYTKMVIKNSFVELLAKKPLTKVTVKEICELSEINRATFYKYYCDPYDLLEKLEFYGKIRGSMIVYRGKDKSTTQGNICASNV